MLLHVKAWRSYSTTALLTPSYSLGFVAGCFLGLQLVTGFVLACHYQPSAECAFTSVDTLMRDLDSGVILRSLHANGASVFFMALYGHMLRCLWHGSASSRVIVWSLGVVIYLLLCGCCFTGYSLVYGQMSLWAIVVICSLVTAIPVVGVEILTLLWGGSVVSGATVNRFFGIHFILPLVLFVLVCLHLWQLHVVNSTGECALVLGRSDRVNFYPLLLVRDVAVGSLFLMVYGCYVYWDQDAFGHPDNYVPANPLVTPAFIAPEWYFLPFYGVIRAIPHKVLGIVVMFALVVSLLSLGDGSLRWLSGFASTSMVRASMLVWLVDMTVCSYVCLCVNHAESLYWLLSASVLGVMVGELVVSSDWESSL